MKQSIIFFELSVVVVYVSVRVAIS